MSEGGGLRRSSELISRADSGLLVVDVQDKLLQLIPGCRRIVWNIRRLIDGAQAMGVPVAATEQYPQGLGGTTPDLADRIGKIPAKTMFSCRECDEIFVAWQQRGISTALIVGIEAHVCVGQTALDLLASGFNVFVAVDAIGSRYAVDQETSLRRLEAAGVKLTTTESVLFEWCEKSGTPEFKRISELVRERPPLEPSQPDETGG